MYFPRWTGVAVLVVCSALVRVPAARAQVQAAAEARITLLNKKAMDEYDSLEFEAAKAALMEAVAVAQGANLSAGRALTTTYLNLGVVYGAGLNDRLSAIKYFTLALRIDRQAALNPARATPALEEMFQSARENVAAAPPPTRAAFRHTPVDEAIAGRTVRLRARVAVAGARSVMLYYRTVGSSEFRQIPMRQVKPGVFLGLIPGQSVKGRSIYYYIEVQNEAGERLQGHGTAISPNIITVQVGRGDDRPPPPPPPPRSGKVFSIGVMVGTGLGIVNGGESEHTQPQADGGEKPVDINPGGALAPFHIAPELSYHINDKWHISVLGRIQLVNAITDASQISLLGEVRAKRYFGEGSFRFYMAFGAGAGQIRHRIPLGDYDKADDAVDKTPDDIVDARVAGIGAFGLGGGFCYMFSSYVGLALELNGLIMVPTFAANLDVNTGLVLSL